VNEFEKLKNENIAMKVEIEKMKQFSNTDGFVQWGANFDRIENKS
jgi:hypothetical protein